MFSDYRVARLTRKLDTLNKAVAVLRKKQRCMEEVKKEMARIQERIVDLKRQGRVKKAEWEKQHRRKWESPPGDEGLLLKTFLQKAQGVIFLEVTVGKRSSAAGIRRIDGVRIQPSQPGKGRFSKSRAEFESLAKGATAEAIEVKKSLNRSVIGQAVVAKHLLEIEYDVRAAVPVVVCEHGDQLLEQVCARLGVTVWILGRPLPTMLMARRQ